MAKKEKIYKEAVITLAISSKATKDEWERYEAAVVAISVRLFLSELGKSGGRFSPIAGDNNPISEHEDDWSTRNYWYVLGGPITFNRAKEEVEAVVKNFRLKNFTKTTVGTPIKTADNLKAELKKERKLAWSWCK